MAKIRAETKKTHELNSKYRESIKSAHSGQAENPKAGEIDQLQASGRDQEVQDELERERKLLQQQQQENREAIRRAWGEYDHVSLQTKCFLL